jgi:hypothetical protein
MLQIVARVDVTGPVVNNGVASAREFDPVIVNNRDAAVLIAMLGPSQFFKRPFVM